MSNNPVLEIINSYVNLVVVALLVGFLNHLAASNRSCFVPVSINVQLAVINLTHLMIVAILIWELAMQFLPLMSICSSLCVM